MRKKFPLYGSWLLSLTLIFGMSTPISAQAESKTTAQVEAVQAKRQAVNSNIGISDRSRNRPMAFPDPYCEIADATDVIVEEITVVEFAGTEISNDDDDNVLIDKTDVVVEITAGDTYTISVEGNANGDFETNIVAFIDWNQNGILDDAGEIYELGTLENSTGYDGVSVSMDITVPADAVPGQTRVRITKTYFDEFSDPIINPCGIEFDPWGMGIYPGYGQALDFTVNVGGGGTFPSPYCGITNGDDIIVHKITEVDFAGTNITNEDGVSPLIDKTDVVADVAVNDTYTLVVEDDAPQNYQSKAVAFIDWNQNGILDDAGEIYELGTLEYPTGHVSMDVTIPSDAVLGETRIRIVKTYFNEFSAAVINPCAIEFEQSSGIWPSLGQALDFTLNIEEDSGGGMAYCIPEGTNSGRYINNFSTTSGSENISNMGSGFSPDGYGDFYDTHTVAQAQGEDVEFEVDIVGGTAGFRVWVDWNQDGVFDTTEEVAYASSGYSTNHTGSFTVPADALVGDTRMRIVSHWLSTTGDVDPCETGFTYGEFEDYKFTVEEGSGGGGGTACEQVFYDAVQPTGVGFSSGNAVANDITVAAGESFTMETMTFDVVNIDGMTSEFDLEIYEDNGSGGVGTTTGMTYHFDSSNMTFVENGTFSIYTQYTVTLTLPNIELTADASEDARYWLAIAADLTTTGDFTYWVSYDYVTNPDSYPSWQYNDTDGWFVYDGGSSEGIMTVSGMCEGAGSGDGCEWTVIVQDTSWGDEVEWELREIDGTVLLSGGGYGNGYYDEQSVTAAGPLEFWITNDGFFGDNTPTYSVSNGTEVLVSGTLETAETLIFSDLNCDSGDPGITYCEPELDCSDGDMITNVTFQEIDNTTGCSPNGYGDYTHLVATVESGETYPISVTVGDGWHNESVSVWIDFDNSGTFDEDEFFFIGTGSDEALTGDIDIPTELAEGQYRMRVRVAAVGAGTATWDMACDESQGYGETEDYTVEVGIGGGGGSDCISTIYDGGNNGSPGGAVYFDVTVDSEDIELTSIDLNIDGAGTGFTVDVYTIEGTHVGNEPNQGAWKM